MKKRFNSKVLNNRIHW